MSGESLADKVVLITGASSGIGAACARLAARRGARLVLCDIDAEAGEALAEELRGQGRDCVFRLCNVTSEEDVSATVRYAVKHFGALDAAINNAGASSPPASLEETRLEDWNTALAVNLTSVFLCVKHELRVMKAQAAGAIVNVGSAASVIGAPDMVAYCAAKHGVLGIGRTAVMENIDTGIRINTVLPGSTRTPMMADSLASQGQVAEQMLLNLPCGRMAEAEEIAETILWLCSDASSFVNGHSLIADGGGLNR